MVQEFAIRGSVNLEFPVFSSPINVLNHVKTLAIFEEAINKNVSGLICDAKYFDRDFLGLFRTLFVS